MEIGRILKESFVFADFVFCSEKGNSHVGSSRCREGKCNWTTYIALVYRRQQKSQRFTLLPPSDSQRMCK